MTTAKLSDIERRALENMNYQRTEDCRMGTLYAMEQKGLVKLLHGVFIITAAGHEALGGDHLKTAKAMRESQERKVAE